MAWRWIAICISVVLLTGPAHSAIKGYPEKSGTYEDAVRLARQLGLDWCSDLDRFVDDGEHLYFSCSASPPVILSRNGRSLLVQTDKDTRRSRICLAEGDSILWTTAVDSLRQYHLADNGSSAFFMTGNDTLYELRILNLKGELLVQNAWRNRHSKHATRSSGLVEECADFAGGGHWFVATRTEPRERRSWDVQEIVIHDLLTRESWRLSIPADRHAVSIDASGNSSIVFACVPRDAWESTTSMMMPVDGRDRGKRLLLLDLSARRVVSDSMVGAATRN